MRYYATFAYPGESAWTEAFATWEDRYWAIVGASYDGADLVADWQEGHNHLTIKSLNIRSVRSRRHYRKLCRLVIGGWIK